MPIMPERLKEEVTRPMPSSSPVSIAKPEVQFKRSDIQLPDEEAPSFGDAVEAAFKTENSLGSLLEFGPSEGFEMEPVEGQALDSFEPMSSIPERHWQEANSYIYADRPQDVERITARLDSEIELRKTLAASGWKGMVSTVAAGALDPLVLPMLFVPGLNVAATGARATRAAGQMALAGATGMGVAETGLHMTQETRTGLESAMNITGAALLSGVMGAAISKLSPADIKLHGENIEKEFMEHPDFSAPRSVGAAEAVSTTLEEEALLGAIGAEKFLHGINPLLRMSNSPSVESRRLIQGLAESPFYTQKNLSGKRSDVAVETLIKMHDARRGASYEAMDSAYVKYRTGAESSSVTKRVAVGVSDLFGARRRSGHLNYREFRAEVSRAMRNGDMHAIPEVAETAKTFRKNIFEPLKNDAIDLGLLPEGVIAKGAMSYLTRVYNTEKIKARRPEFKATLSKWVRQQSDEFEQVEADGLADDIIDNIMGHNSGTIPKDIVPQAGPLKERVLDIEDNLIQDFLEDDIEVIAEYYIRTMAPEIELTKRFGSKNMDDQIAKINDDYNSLAAKAKNEKEAKKLEKRRDDDIRDTKAVRDLLLGTYGQPNDPASFFVRASRGVREVNFLRMLGGMTVSAIPDLARTTMVHGLGRTGRGLTALASSPAKFKMAAKELKSYGAAWEMVLNTRARSISDVGDFYRRGTWFERGLKSMSDSYGVPSLMSPWNAALKQFAGVVTADTILDGSVSLAKGVANANTIKKLAQRGIDADIASRISKQFKKFGEGGDINLGHVDQWTDKEAATIFKAAVLKDVDTIIVTPGVADRPLIMATEMGKTVGQFKSFAFAATNRMMLAGLQQRDAAALNGLFLSVALGSVVYGAKQALGNREISSDPAVVITEAIDRSGALGVLTDVNNIIEKATRGTVGISALTGGPQMSRYASRNAIGALLGPSFGTASDLVQIIGAISTQEVAQSDVHAMRKMVPYQNLFYIRSLLDKLEDESNRALGTGER